MSTSGSSSTRAWIARTAAVAFVLLLLTGCTTAPAPSERLQVGSRLIRTQAGSQVTLQWDAREGALYRVLYAEDASGRVAWYGLPGYQSVAGQGPATRVSFEAPAPGDLRYRVDEVSRSSR